MDGMLMQKKRYEKARKGKKISKKSIRGKRSENKEKTGIKTAVNLREKHDNV
jgi:hypothetical protein